MANKMKKLLSLILAISMVMSLFTVGASATEDGEGETAAANQQQVEYEGGSASNGDGVTVSKTIEGTDDENVFDITLKVDTQKSIEEVYRKAQSTAVVIVMDISHTMKEQFGNSNRYEAAIAAASSFMTSFAAIENPDNAERKIGFVAFNTDAHEVFGLSSCTTADQAKALVKTMKTVTGNRIGSNDFCKGGSKYCVSGGSKCAYHDSSSKNYSSVAATARFTNIEAGLKMGADMLAASGAENQYIVFLSDGFPTTYMVDGTKNYAGYNVYTSSGKVGTSGVFYNQKTKEYCGSGTSYSDEAATRAQTMAANIKATGTKIYSIGIDVTGQSIAKYEETDKVMGSYSVIDCYGGDGYVISDFKAWLKNKIGSGYYWDSNNASQLNAAFAEILAAIKDSVVTNSLASWVASDPMNAQNTTAIDFLQFYDKNGKLVDGNLVGPADSENTASFANDAINWDLKNSVCTEIISEDGKTITYHYELKYRVRLANEATGFVEKEIVQTNGTTTLKYQYVETVNGKETISEVKSVDFPIPEVEGYLTELTFKKTGTNGKGLAGATFTLTHKSDCKVCGHLVNANLQFPESYTAVSAADGTVTFTGIPSGHDYVLQETKAPEGYALNTAKYDVTVAYDVLSVKGYEDFESVVNTKLNKLSIAKVVDVPAVSGTNVHAEMLTEAALAGTTTYTFSVVGKKNDGSEVYRNDNVTVTVAAVTSGEGENAKTTITGSVELINLPDGTYTVTEQGEGTYTYGGATYTVAASYEGNNVPLDDGDEVTINVKNTYTYNPEYVQVNVTKDWQDANDQDGKRPESITYNLLAGEDMVDSKTVTAEGGWAASFTRLPKYENGKEITYTVTEDAVADYTSSVEEAAGTTESASTKAFVVTNSHTPEVTSVSGVKTWNDENNADGKRPVFITVNLLKNGEEIAEKTVSSATGWAYSWDNLPKYENGQLISYSVSEDPVTDYTASYSGYNITNTYVPGKTDIVAQKVWDDADNQDGIRASSVTVQLKADGEAVGEAVTLNEANGWRYTWNSLNYNKNGGVKIEYTVEEIDAPAGYTASVTNEGYVYTVKNSHTPEVTSVTVNKVWADSAERLMKPVTMNLYADGELIDSQTLSASNQWTYTWTNLAKNKGGVAIAYTVDEEDLGNYWYKKVSNEGNVWTVENSYYVPVYTSRTVVKVWDDDNNVAEARPESVTVQLLYNGMPFGAAVTLSAENGWTYTWSNLSDVGEWTITEVNVPEDYTSKVELSGTTYTITNTYEEEIPDENPPMSDWEEEEEFEEEDVPLADVPATGDLTALWAAASVVSAAGLFVLGKKNKDEE